MRGVVDPATLKVAERLADLEHVRSVCLIGSAARGEAGPSSDIDLLAVVDAHPHVQEVRLRAAETAGDHRVQTKVLAEDRLADFLAGRSSFAVHVLREAVVLHDEGHRFEHLRARLPRDAPILADPDRLRGRLELYGDLAWCQGQYLYCLADCYSVGRSAAYALLTRDSVFEFSAPKALARLGRNRLDLADECRRIAALQPFYLLAERDIHVPLPHSYRGCLDEAKAAVRATRTLVDALGANGAR
jgi:predicted nucleotidyltransferase